ncbi:hypothetical protein O4H61_16515 [Roseovarius aestuarii]|nr:hypothetical protein [Roseovarius aestuarii]
MIRKNLLALTLIAVCSPAFAQNIEAMNPKELQDAATAAVTAEDADLLLEIMQEMQRREMLFFRAAENPMCDREPQKEGYFSTAHPGHFSTARQWYFMKLRETRLGEESCECLMASASFGEILEEQFGITANDISKTTIVKMQQERDEFGRLIESQYQSFHRANCRGE